MDAKRLEKIKQAKVRMDILSEMRNMEKSIERIKEMINSADNLDNDTLEILNIRLDINMQELISVKNSVNVFPKIGDFIVIKEEDGNERVVKIMKGVRGISNEYEICVLVDTKENKIIGEFYNIYAMMKECNIIKILR